MINKIDAIMSLVPAASVTQLGDDIIWHEPNIAPVTEEQIAAELIRLRAEHEANEYQRLRANEYPSMADQLDMLYHDKINNTNTWLDAIQAIKNKYPKG